jgi:hypothetical protein
VKLFLKLEITLFPLRIGYRLFTKINHCLACAREFSVGL